MLPGLRLTSAATLALAASLFNRRSLDGWLGELDDIRGDALDSPEVGVSHAMSDLGPLHGGELSPLHLFEQPLPPPGISPRPVEDQLLHLAAVTPTPDAAPAPEPAVRVQPSPHPMRPSEMWHPQVTIAPSPLTEVHHDGDDISGEVGADIDAETDPEAELFAVDSIIQADGAPLGIVAAPYGRSAPADVAAAVAPEVPVARVLAVAIDGTVAVDEGIVRVTEALDPVVEQGPDGIALALDAGWCWADRTEGAAPLTIAMPAGSLTVPTGTAALAVIEADHSSFVVVVEGEALLHHHGGRLRLRAGAMALAPVGGEPRIDVATEAEILADPLLQHNLRLDGER